jgi:hypothetical protein
MKKLKPWRQSSGPKTEAGKARSAKNALKSGWFAAGGPYDQITELAREMRAIERAVEEAMKGL